MAREPKTLYSLTEAENVTVTDLVGTIDAAMLLWNPDESQHTFDLADNTNFRVARQLRKEYRGAGWEVELTFKTDVPTTPVLVFRDPNHAENLASLP